MAKTLSGILVTRSGEDFLLRLEDEDGEHTDFTANYDVLDQITEAIEDALDQSEDDALDVTDDEDEPAED